MSRKLLLHTCCAPCFAYVFEILKDSYDITSYYYNPNIAPSSEYNKRLIELKGYSEQKKFSLIAGEYDIRKWVSAVKTYRFHGERSQRCAQCFRFRLTNVFEYARRESFDAVATALTISPHKDAHIINGVGKELENAYQIEFLGADYKKNDGYSKSVALSRAIGFYRQNYCGCIYSRMEREKDSLWYLKYRKQHLPA